MFSLAIKNSVLTILIVLILHFLFKNILRERELARPSSDPKYRVKCEPSETSKVVEAEEHVTESDRVHVEEAFVEEEEQKVAVPACNEIKEIMKDSKTIDDDLDTWFMENSLSSSFKESSNKKLQFQNQQSNGITTNAENGTRPQLYSKQNETPNLIVNSFEKENSLNGGKLYGDLAGFDSQFMSYSEL